MMPHDLIIAYNDTLPRARPFLGKVCTLKSDSKTQIDLNSPLPTRQDAPIGRGDGKRSTLRP